MDIFEIVDRFDPLDPADKMGALRYYLQKGDEERALSFLDCVGMLGREMGRDCLFGALCSCSPEVFRRLLDHVPRGEYAGYWNEEEPPLFSSVQKPCGQIAGTLPTLAAAMGKAEHLRLLLDWGCDVNGASLDAATALANHHYPGTEITEPPLALRGAPTTDSMAWWSLRGNTLACFCGVTPLAAAILFGSVDCVRLLLAREGVWLTKTPAVSEALAVRGESWNSEAHRECRRLVRTKADGALRPLLLWAAIRRMDATALRDELCYCEHGQEEVVRAALVLMGCDTMERNERWAMLAVLDGRYGETLHDARIARAMAALTYREYEYRNEPLPETAEHVLGDVVDLDESVVGNANYSATLAEACLKRLGKSRRLVMSRDSIWPDGPISASYLRTLMKYVAFRPPSLPVGVSGLTRAILQTGDVRLLRSALAQGLIPAEEPIRRLLELAGKNTAARSLLLTHSRPSLGITPAGAERNSHRELTDDETKRVLDDPALRAAASDALLERCAEKTAERLSQTGKTLSAGGMETRDDMALYALRGETDAVLRCAVRKEDGAERATLSQVWRAGESDSDTAITLLCCAAVGGQTETVRALLDAGFDPEERDMGRPSRTWIESKYCLAEKLALSPLLCALLWEHWDTTALLLDRGAACDLTSYTVRRAFETLRGGDVPYGDIRRELGAYLEGRRLGKDGKTAHG